MTSHDDILAALSDATVIAEDGAKVGTVGQVFVDDSTGEPAWATVRRGLFGRRETFVPLPGADVQPGAVRVGYAKHTITSAPPFRAGQHLDAAAQDELYRYYDLTPATREQPAPERTDEPFGRDLQGNPVDPQQMTDEERERLNRAREAL